MNQEVILDLGHEMGIPSLKRTIASCNFWTAWLNIRENETVVNATTEIRLFLEADWLISSRFKPWVQETKWNSYPDICSTVYKHIKQSYLKHTHHTDTNIQTHMLWHVRFFFPAVERDDLLPVILIFAVTTKRVMTDRLVVYNWHRVRCCCSTGWLITVTVTFSCHPFHLYCTVPPLHFHFQHTTIYISGWLCLPLLLTQIFSQSLGQIFLVSLHMQWTFAKSHCQASL